MRIEQYIQMMDYSLWEVIKKGKTLPKTQVLKGVTTMMPITSVEDNAKRRLEVKVRSTLLMGIPNEHQLKFNSIKDAKMLLEAIKKRYGGNAATKKIQRNLLKQQFKNFFASRLGTNPSRLEEMDLKWQMVMLTMRSRRFLKKTGRKLNVIGNESINFDKSKVECYNCYKNRHFSREYRAPMNQDNMHKESTRRIVPVETTNSSWSHVMDLEVMIGVIKQRKVQTMHSWHTHIQVQTQRLDEFSNKSKVENCDAKSSEKELKEPKIVRKNYDASIIEEWVSDDEEKEVAQPKIVKKTVKPSIAKIETPALSFMRPFGYPVTILNTKDHLRKFDGNADERFFVGYSLNSKAFRVLNTRTRIVEENLHIRFSENTSNVVGGGADWLFDIDELTRTISYEIIVTGTQSNDFAESKSYQDDGFQPSSDDGKKVDEDPRQESKCKDQEKEDNVNKTNNRCLLQKILTHLTSQVIMKMMMKWLDMNNLDTTIQVSLVHTTRIHKDHPLEQVIEDLHSTTQTRNMSKNLEEHGFVTAINHRTNHKDLQNYLFACFLSQEEPTKMDVKSAFLYGKIEEDVYVCQPLGFEDPDFPNKVYKVEKALYGLNQALRAWYETLSTYLLDNGFHKGKIDKTLIIKRHKGLQVKQKQDGIFISQDKYVAEILKKYGFIEVKNASTHMETQKPLLKDKDGEEVDIHMYRSMISSLMYLTSSRPDIMFAYSKDSLFDLVAYTDSNYAGASLDMKSTTGGFQFLRCRLISWQCKKQTMVVNSTTEAEYVAALSCCRQVLWIQN
nr:hypothetical protein [Tanacetum cinerariifolium]